MIDPEIVVETWADLGPRLATIFESVHTPYALLTLDHRFIVANSAYSEATGRHVADLRGKSLFDAFPENPENAASGTAASITESINRVIDTGSADSLPIHRFDIADADGEFVERYWHTTTIPIHDADGKIQMLLLHVEELTSFVQERLRLDRRSSFTDPNVTTYASPLQAVGDVFTAELSRLESLSGLASALVGAQTPTEVGRAVMRDGLDLVGACAGSLVMLDSEWFVTVADHGIDDVSSQKWEQFVLDVGNEPFSDAISKGEALFFENRKTFLDAYPALDDEIARNGEHSSWVVLPLRAGDHVSGAIGLIFDEPRTFDAPLRLVMYTLADLTAQAASRAQLLSEQHEALHSVEVALQPRIDPIPGIAVSHLYRPATVAASAGGDWYDVIELSDERTMIAIGDVADHGAVAIGEMSRFRFTAQAFAAAGFQPAEIIRRTDELLARTATSQATAVLAILDHRSSELTWTTAGHPFPVVVDRNGAIVVLSETHGAPLGTGSDARVRHPTAPTRTRRHPRAVHRRPHRTARRGSGRIHQTTRRCAPPARRSR